jgi:hypothetical protein
MANENLKTSRSRCVFRTGVVRTAMACAFSLTALAPAFAQSCNPFEFLFGGCRPQQEPRQVFTPIPSPLAGRRALPARHAVKKAERARIARASVARSGGVSGKQTALQPEPDAPVGSLALFARDRTLRPGDIVVTKAGFLVYGGRTGAFAPIAHDSGALATLEKASMKSQNATFAAPQITFKAAPASTPEAPRAAMTQAFAPQQTSEIFAAPQAPIVNSWLAVRREAAIERIAVKTAAGFGG